jgi:hypothetical protein
MKPDNAARDKEAKNRESQKELSKILKHSDDKIRDLFSRQSAEDRKRREHEDEEASRHHPDHASL